MKTAVIFHSVDLDGWMSAAIVKHWFGSKVEIPINTLDFIGYNYGQDIPDLSEYGEVIMCDVSFSFKETLKLVERLGLNFIWLDHHISAIKENDCIMISNQVIKVPIKINGLRDTKFAACELTWQAFFPDEPMPEIVRLLGRYDCFGGYKTDEWQKILEFQFGARSMITNYEEAYQQLILSIKDFELKKKGVFTFESIILEKGKNIYSYLCTEAKQAYKNGFEITLQEPFIGQWGSGKTDRKFICINKERFNPINFGIDYHEDGYDGCACFHYADEIWNFSIYCENGLVDCTQIAKQYGGGGHAGASGFKLNNEKFLKIITKNFV
jgi:hypothetical protein